MDLWPLLSRVSESLTLARKSAELCILDLRVPDFVPLTTKQRTRGKKPRDLYCERLREPRGQRWRERPWAACADTVAAMALRTASLVSRFDVQSTHECNHVIIVCASQAYTELPEAAVNAGSSSAYLKHDQPPLNIYTHNLHSEMLAQPPREC